MQPISETSITRPWHWGIAIIGVPGGTIPELIDDSPVTATADTVVVHVRHAQDIEGDKFEGDWDWATATLRVRFLTEEEPSERRVLFDGVLPTAEGLLWVGDADAEVVVAAHHRSTRVVVSTDGESPTSFDLVRVDLIPSPE